jgi:hypothetical protein
MIDHCYAVSGEINPLFFISSLFSFMFLLTFIYLFLENSNQKPF